jgi:hypothetical protein
MLVVSGNAAATAANIVTHAGLFHVSIVAGIIGAACHIAWTLLFYELFKPVNKTLSLLAALVSIVAIEPVGTGSAQIRQSIAPNRRRVR